MNYKQFLPFLETLRPSQFKMELQPLKEACHEMGDPQLKFPSAHIAGTNGKGSTAAMLASILENSGLKVGLYTSPHLLDVKERIKINEEQISEEKLAIIATVVLDNLSSPKQLSYFEFLTIASFKYFSDEKVDIAVIETGLGGRLDATILVKPKVVVITSISEDHMKHLGSTLTDIAKEKCGIIKRGVPTISAMQKDEVMVVIQRACDDAGSPLIIADPVGPDMNLGLNGEHQRQNAACAIEAAHILATSGLKINAFKEGLENVKWPGRLETVKTLPNVVTDGAHNAAGAEALAKYISQNVPRSNAVLLLGTLSDKNISAICSPLVPVVREVICVKPPSSRAASPKDIAAVARSFGAKVHVEENVESALKSWLPKLSDTDTIFVTGSLTTVGEAMNYFNNNKLPKK